MYKISVIGENAIITPGAISMVLMVAKNTEWNWNLNEKYIKEIADIHNLKCKVKRNIHSE